MTAFDTSDPRVEAGARLAQALAEDAQAAQNEPGLTAAQHRQMLIEVERRSIGGLYVHLPAWLTLAISSGLVERIPGWVAGIALFMLLNSLGRIALHRRFAALVARRAELAESLFLGLLLSSAAVWGGVLTAAYLWPPMMPAHDATRLVVLAICAGVTMTLSMMKRAGIGMPLLLFGPYMVALLTHATVAAGSLAVLLLIFLGYIVVVSRLVQRDYWAAVRAHALLAERAQAFELLSITDALTQVYNRLHFDRIVTKEWARAQRSGDLVTVLIVDLDHFKRINDGHGHPFGDVCLKAAAAALRRVIFRPADVLARYGGEEFVVLLPGTDVAGSLVVAQRLLQAVGNLALASPLGSVSLSCSIGAATMRPMAGVDWMALMSQADAALYRAKAEGRNRVVLAERWPPGVLAVQAAAQPAAS